MSIRSETARYLRTGEHDPLYGAWQGNSTFERCQRGHEALRLALFSAVRRRAEAVPQLPVLQDLDTTTFTRRKVEPMVRGLFPPRERGPVLDILEHSVVFLMPTNIEQVLRNCTWMSTAWELANLYLASIGAELLEKDAPQIVGLSVETTCYVSLTYFTDQDPFADYVVHEAAHVFHNCKRATAGLAEIRRREWLLDIDFCKRETFAYSCEAYARIVESASGPRERIKLSDEYRRDQSHLPDERADANEVADIVAEACAARNGWKVILARSRNGLSVSGRWPQ
jgi:hypothetical protein